jgi:hypothetical protein
VGAAWLLASAACSAVTGPDEFAVPEEVEHQALAPGDGLSHGPRARRSPRDVGEAPSRRFAGLFSFGSESSCSQSWAIYHSTASFVLDLAGDGVATACRGRRSVDVGGAWDHDPREVRFDEQQGLTGTWWRAGKGWIEIELAPDDGPCSPIRAHAGIDLRPWTLRCKVDEASFSVAVLACRFADPVPSDTLGFATAYAAEGQWMLLGAGEGVVVDWNSDDSASELAVERAAAPITPEAWAGKDPPEPVLPGKGGPRVLAR